MREVRYEDIVEAVRRGLLDDVPLSDLVAWAAVFSGERAPIAKVCDVDISGLAAIVREVEELEANLGRSKGVFSEVIRALLERDDLDGVSFDSGTVFRFEREGGEG